MRMEENTMDKTNECLLYFMACALSGTPASENALDGVNLGQLLGAARSHTVGAMVCMALEKTAAFSAAPAQVQKHWLDGKNKAIRKNMLLDAERKAVLDELEKRAIWYMPLKGCILKDWYPKPGMREMADNDILIDPAGQAQVREIFRQRGYGVVSYQKGNHDIYEKPPVYNFEMHTSLFHEQYEALAGEYADIKQRLLPMDGTRFGFQFSPEDFYVFVLAHAYKHFSHSGTGVRTLADIYVMNRRLDGVLNREAVAQKLTRLGIAQYEQESRALADKLFHAVRPLCEIQWTAEEEKLLCYYLGATTYGNLNNSVVNRLHELQKDEAEITPWTKLKYCWVRLFPGRQWCKTNAPTVYRYPCLLPFFWVWRFFSKLGKNHKKIRAEIKVVAGVQTEKQ